MKRLFVTGGTGFIGARFVSLALEAGYRVQVLTRNTRAAERWKHEGVTVVQGDLLTPGPWQEEAATSEGVVHLAQPLTFGARVTHKRAEAYRDQRLRMDSLLLDSLKPGTVKRLLYVGGTSYYGDQGTRLVAEDATPHPTGWGPYIAPAIESLPRHLERGLPLVEAYPGSVYGLGSWFEEYALEPMKTGKRIFGLKESLTKQMSPIHVDDCARALLHLLEHGEVGRRYFVVDDQPATFGELSQVAAEALGVSYKKTLVPRWLCNLLMGPVVTDSLTSEARLSNARLHGTGFQFLYPTIREGVPALVRQWLEARRRS
ncbi:NAD-dependent epimerase/dehydratase family protein [Archangium lansingense]|uniref:NAD(P)-dependent oxidoreductase n=1 Tax=Archangium lansingense TaxID=2995310 RepID=A0ABT4A308_9BACT|nr:NAD(P)-dependent oxidoreductase [Archangium lansinium]MCY1076038.1 NAD(P)-dependent oxidoreductase [Archangium lansinium]